MAAKKSTAVIKPNLGLYLDRPTISLPPGALANGLNFRVQLGKVNNYNLGWQQWNGAAVTSGGFHLNGTVMWIDNFLNSEGTSSLLFLTTKDMYYYNPSGSILTYITPIYSTGTATCAASTAVTGAGTAWDTVPTGSTRTNVRAGDQIAFTTNAENSLTATWYTVASVGSNTSLTLTVAGPTVSTHVYTVRQLFGGTAADLFVREVFVDGDGSGNDLVFFTNGVDNVVTWYAGAASATYQNGFGFTCKTLTQAFDAMIYGNATVISGGAVLATTIYTSETGSPLLVGSAAAGNAGQFIVQSQTDPILAMGRIGNYLAIYCQNNIILMSATGSTTQYAFNISASKKGIVGTHALMRYPTIHQFIAPDGMYYFDGTNVQPINTQIWRSVISSTDFVRIGNIYSFLDEANGEVIWSVPQTTDPNAGNSTAPPAQAWTEHYLEETAGQVQSALISSAMGDNRPYSTRSFPFTAVGSYTNQSALLWSDLTSAWQTYNYTWNSAFFSISFPTVLAGDINGYVYQLNIGQSGNGTALQTFITFGRRPLVDGKMRSLLRRIYPFVDQTAYPLTVTAAFADNAMASPLHTQTATFDQTFSTQGAFFVPIYRRGRYVDVSFGDSTGNPWNISGFDYDVLPGGLR